MLAKTFGCCRYVYNWALELREKAHWIDNESISRCDMKSRVIHELRDKQAPFLNEVSATSISFAVDDLYEGYTNYFKGLSEKPKKRLKHGRQHYHDRPTKGRGVRVKFKQGLISIPKIKDIPCVFHRRFKGTIKQVGVELLSSGKYRVSVLVDDGKPLPAKVPIDPSKTIGIDIGLKHYIVTSDGMTDEPTQFARKESHKLKLLQRRLNKKELGSRKFRILKHRIARLHEHIANRRTDHINKVTHYLASENQATTICVEDLNVVGMVKNKYLSYNLQDASFGEFFRQLKYKCEWAGKNYIKIGRFAPSSKRCSHCGYIYKRLRLSEREWTCPECGTHHDRDLNAAYNIKHFGLCVNETLPSVRRKVKPVEQPLVDDRSLEPKKLCCCTSD